jgi:hypothetical protein
MSVSLVFMVDSLSGIFAFGLAENQCAHPDAQSGQATLLGASGMARSGISQTLLSVLMVWWLSQPSDLEANVCGPKPT